MNERLKKLRRTLGLNQDEFGKRLGVGKTAISKLEKAENKLTEQMIKLICREYNVDYLWITTGQGEMFSNSDTDIMAKIDFIMSSENETAKRIFSSFAKLSTEEWLVIEKIIDGLTNN